MLHFPDSGSCLDIFTLHHNSSARQHSQAPSQVLAVLICPRRDAQDLHVGTGRIRRRHLTSTYCVSPPTDRKITAPDEKANKNAQALLNPNRTTSFCHLYINGAEHLTQTLV